MGHKKYAKTNKRINKMWDLIQRKEMLYKSILWNVLIFKKLKNKLVICRKARQSIEMINKVENSNGNVN